jgi:hypothetical protein
MSPQIAVARLHMRGPSLVLSAILAIGVAGCAVPREITMAPNLTMPTKQVATASRREVRRLPGELDEGSASHALAVNGVQLVITYFTPEDARSWTRTSEGAVNVSAQVQGINSRRMARITRFRLVAPPHEGSGDDTVLVNDTGQFVIGAPYSYGSAFTFPEYPKGTKQVKVRAYVDLEIETRPRSGEYARQSLIDILRVSTVPVPLEDRQESNDRT